ncbi:MAG: glycosyltransferase family 4 protein, partial [Patescibacteria group bacterium]|nr:glycosyltransferase family 4 protein [Patescibacteria group bacterium]
FPVIIVTSAASAQAKSKFDQANITLIELSGRSTNNIVYWLFLNSFLKKETRSLVELATDSQVVISSHFPSNVVGNNLGKPHIFCCWEPYALFHDPNYVEGFNLYQRQFIKYLTKRYKHLDIQATKKADKIITLSKFNKQWIKNVYGRSDALISYEGVDTKFFKQQTNSKIRNKYKKFKIILHSTDFTKIKGTDYLLNALPLVTKAIPNVKLLITHTLINPDKRKETEELINKLGIRNNVEFLGRVDYQLLPAYYSLADVVVQPSIKQSMNLTIKEAMSCGTPVVTGLEGNEQTANGRAGFLVKSSNSQEIAKAVLKILKNSQLAHKMGKNGRQIILDKFSWDSVTQVFINSISLLL